MNDFTQREKKKRKAVTMNEESDRVPWMQTGQGTGRTGQCLTPRAWLGADETVTVDLHLQQAEKATGECTRLMVTPCLACHQILPNQGISNTWWAMTTMPGLGAEP